ncbi:multicopper oxidase domain-containing protein [Kitasatospora sp. NPDC002040]|uniref:multicopper oxidase family protein n=1 Tax=Kitasatospora sp. NPDC002040 TaxID=3154661 RepID=UPI003333D4E7
MLSRRNALKAGVVTTGIIGTAGVVAPTLTSGSAAAADTGTAAPAVIPQFAVPLTIPQVLAPVMTSGTTDYYNVTMKKVLKEVVPGKPTEFFTYNGQLPGPTIKARRGRRVVIRQTNQLDMPTSVHLHGAEVPVDSDGSPMNTVAPGASKVYTYPNNQAAAPLWIHDHAHHMESEHVYRGLSSMYLLTDDREQSLGLPSGQYDVPIVIRDGRFDENGQLIYVMDDFLNRNTITVNGRPWPFFQVAARKYRFRLLNSTNVRFFVLKLSDGSTFTQIGSDGGLLAQPNVTSQISLSPGERADVVIDFSRYPVGTQLVLENLLGPGPAEQVGRIMRFDVTRTAPDNSTVPARLGVLPAPRQGTVNRTFTLRMDEDGRPDTGAYINGQTYDPNRIDLRIAWGTTEVWTVTNANQFAPHNFHVHLVQFRVLERNGQAPGPAEAGLKDTVQVLPGETVKLVLTFNSYRGVYLFHCHMFDHGAMGMMGTMEIA